MATDSGIGELIADFLEPANPKYRSIIGEGGERKDELHEKLDKLSMALKPTLPETPKYQSAAKREFGILKEVLMITLKDTEGPGKGNRPLVEAISMTCCMSNIWIWMAQKKKMPYEKSMALPR